MRRLILCWDKPISIDIILPIPHKNYTHSQPEFEQFREKLYQSFNYRRDTIMDLVDAIAANTTARSKRGIVFK